MTEDTFAKLHRVLCEAKEEYERPTNQETESNPRANHGSAIDSARIRTATEKTMAGYGESAEVVRGER